MFNFSKKQSLVENVVKYEKINFYHFFKNNGYIQKVLCLYKNNSHANVVFYSKREKTEIACISNEIFIVADYGKEGNPHTYTLVQTDFNIPMKFQILMQDSSQNNLFEYIRRNNLVEIKEDNTPKKPHFYSNYGAIIIEVLNELIKENVSNKQYTANELVSVLVENLNKSEKHQNLLKTRIIDDISFKMKYYGKKLSSEEIAKEKKISEVELSETSEFRIKISVETIFDNIERKEITLDEVLKTSKMLEYNHYYNL